MPGPYGVQPAGWVSKPLTDTLAEIQAAQIAAIGPDLDVSAESLLGILNAIVATQVTNLYELGQAVTDARDPNAATGAQLDALAQITGTVRQVATQGIVTLLVTLGAGVTLPAGSVAGVPGQPLDQWATLTAVTNTGGSPGAVAVQARAVTAGAIAAPAHAINTIVTPVVGWTVVDNPAAAVTGLDEDTDVKLRQRRLADLTVGGAGTQATFVAALLRQSQGQVQQCSVYVNVMDNPVTVAGQSIPGHGFMAVVFDGTTAPALPVLTDDQIAALIWAQTPMGIATAGPNNGHVVDTNGVTQQVNFARPVGVPIYITVNVKEGPAYDGTATPAAIKAALVTYATATFKPGVSVIHAFLFGVVAVDPSQVADVLGIALDTHVTPTGIVNLPMTVLQIATLDPAHITVVGTP